MEKSRNEEHSIECALYLIPVEIDTDSTASSIPAGNLQIVSQLRTFIVENLRTARRTLRRWIKDFPIDECRFYEVSEHTSPREMSETLDAMRRGTPIGVMSEAGCPAVADPGADVVAIAQSEGMRVVPLVGPSSIIMSLMASGFNGQGFAFKGYLPVKEDQKIKAIKELEQRTIRTGETQIFIEAPYRNNRLIKTLSETLHGDTKVCVACDITNNSKESIRTLRASQWRNINTDYDKRPAIFLIGL